MIAIAVLMLATLTAGSVILAILVAIVASAIRLAARFTRTHFRH